MEGIKWRKVPYLARYYPAALNLLSYMGPGYYDPSLGDRPGAVEVSLIRCTMEDDNLPDKENDPYYDQMTWEPHQISTYAICNQTCLDQGIIYEWHNMGIKILHIWHVKLQYRPDPVKFSCKFDRAAKEFKLEVDHSSKNEQEKKIVNFPIATDGADKLLSKVVDGYEVKYMLYTNAIRLQLELEIILSTPNTELVFDVHGSVVLEFERDGKHSISLFDSDKDENPMKKGKLSKSNTFNLSSILIVPPTRRCIRVQVSLYDKASKFKVNDLLLVFPYTIPVDQRDFIKGENGYISSKAFWGCLCFDQEVCTCEPGVLIGFRNPCEAEAGQREQ